MAFSCLCDLPLPNFAASFFQTCPVAPISPQMTLQSFRVVRSFSRALACRIFSVYIKPLCLECPPWPIDLMNSLLYRIWYFIFSVSFQTYSICKLGQPLLNEPYYSFFMLFIKFITLFTIMCLYMSVYYLACGHLLLRLSCTQ